MANAINEELYYFVLSHEGLYYPVFFSWIMPAMAEDFKKLRNEKTYVHIELEVPNNRFICDVNRPLFMFNIKHDISLYSSDSERLDLCPDGSCPPKVPRYIMYPKYFSASVETLFEYSLCKEGLCQRSDKGWVVLKHEC